MVKKSTQPTTDQVYSRSLLDEDLINIYRWSCSQISGCYLADNYSATSVIPVLAANVALFDHDCFIAFLSRQLRRASSGHVELWQKYLDLTKMALSRREVPITVYQSFLSDLTWWLDNYNHRLFPEFATTVAAVLTRLQQDKSAEALDQLRLALQDQEAKLLRIQALRQLYSHGRLSWS